MFLSRIPLTVAFAAAAGCGPSFQAVYESDVHFEHCYALDETTAASEAKQQCWREWLSGYTYGQSRDRVEYATARAKASQAAPPLSDDDPPAPAAPNAAPHAVAAAPMPTNAFAPPPALAAADTPDASPDALASSLSADTALDPRAPASECVDGCERRWTGCHERCRDGTCVPCDRAYRACVPACFRDTVSDSGPRPPLSRGR